MLTHPHGHDVSDQRRSCTTLQAIRDSTPCRGTGIQGTEQRRIWGCTVVGGLGGDRAAPTASPSPIQLPGMTQGAVKVTFSSRLEPGTSQHCWEQRCHGSNASPRLFLTTLGFKSILKTPAEWLSPSRDAQLPAPKHLQPQAPWKSFPALSMDAKGVF